MMNAFISNWVSLALLCLEAIWGGSAAAQERPIGPRRPLPLLEVKTNALYWATSSLNAGFETGLTPDISLVIDAGYNPWTFGDNRKFKLRLLQPEVRHWFGCRSEGHFPGRAFPVCRLQCRRREVYGHGRPAVRGKPVRGGRGIRIPVACRKALERRGYGGFGLSAVGLRTLCMEAVRPVSRPGTQKLLRTDENRRVVLFRNRMTGTKTGVKSPVRVRSYRHEPRR